MVSARWPCEVVSRGDRGARGGTRNGGRGATEPAGKGRGAVRPDGCLVPARPEPPRPAGGTVLGYVGASARLLRPAVGTLAGHSQPAQPEPRSLAVQGSRGQSVLCLSVPDSGESCSPSQSRAR